MPKKTAAKKHNVQDTDTVYTPKPPVTHAKELAALTAMGYDPFFDNGILMTHMTRSTYADAANRSAYVKAVRSIGWEGSFGMRADRP